MNYLSISLFVRTGYALQAISMYLSTLSDSLEWSPIVIFSGPVRMPPQLRAYSTSAATGRLQKR